MNNANSTAEKIVAHTPGPWTIEQSYDPRTGPHVYVNAEIENNGTSAPGGTFSIAEISDDSYLGPYGSQEGNARLIAAAPDLLTAAHAAFHALKSYQYGNASPALAEECAAVLSDALAKAEGRS